jgi:hypothetical protein
VGIAPCPSISWWQYACLATGSDQRCGTLVASYQEIPVGSAPLKQLPHKDRVFQM